jgi:hypothetical protein
VLNWPTFAVVLFVSITSANILQFLLHSGVVALLYSLRSRVLPKFTKECNYRIRAKFDQI